MSTPDPTRRRHVHVFFAPWQHESRAMRAGASAIQAGLAERVEFVGYRAAGFPDEEKLDDRRTIRRIGARPPKPGSPRLLRALSVPRWWWAAWRRASAQDISIVTAHSIAALPAGVLVARRSGAALLYDAHELETEREGWSPFIRWIARCFERFFIRRCDHTIVVNDSILRWYEQAYPGLSVSTVRNVPVIPPVTAPSRLRETIGIGPEPLLFVYCGLLGEGRGLFETIEAFAAGPSDRHFALVGFGPMEAEIRAAAARHPNIHVVPAVDQSELISLLSGADVGVFLPTGTSVSYHNALPNKVFEYCAAGLALLLADAPEMRRFADEHPIARAIPVTVENIRREVERCSAEEIRRARAASTFAPPSWAQEMQRLLDAYAVVLRSWEARTKR